MQFQQSSMRNVLLNINNKPRMNHSHSLSSHYFPRNSFFKEPNDKQYNFIDLKVEGLTTNRNSNSNYRILL